MRRVGAAGDARPGTGLRFCCDGRTVIVVFILGPNNGRSKVDDRNMMHYDLAAAREELADFDSGRNL